MITGALEFGIVGRAVERGRAPAWTRYAMKSCKSARVVFIIGTPRSASQRDSAVRSARYAASVFEDRPRSIQTASRKRETAGSVESALEALGAAARAACLDKTNSLQLEKRTQYGEHPRRGGVTIITSVWKH